MQVTIKDIASKLNLSPTTISRVLNGRESELVSEKTKQTVLQTAMSMGYRPNKMARALVTGQTRNIALWVYAVHPSYYSSIIHYVSEILWEEQFEVQVVEVGRERSLLDICSWPCDGIIAFDCAERVENALDNGMLANIPTVVLGSTDTKSTDCVTVDLATGTSVALKHLLETRKDIAMLSGATLAPDIRRCSYEMAMDNAGLPRNFIVIDTPSLPAKQAGDAYKALKKFLENHKAPDALFCYNDQTAIGAYRAIQEAGLKIPDDIAVVGCDGIDISEYLNPRLTTIAQPFEQMCSTAWQFLQARMNDADMPRQSQVLQCRLEIRGSSSSACIGR